MVAEIRNILIVEDDPSIRRLTTRMITAMGHCAHAVEDGSSALDRCSVDPDRIDLILSDVCMENMGGIELVEALRRRNMHTKIILVSGHNDVGQLDGDTFFVQKPFTRQILEDAINEALGATA